MPGSGGINTQTQAISGYGQSRQLPDGMTLDNTTIGSTTPAAGTFTTLTATSQRLSSSAIETFTTTGGTLANSGITVLAPSSAASYVLPAPSAVGQIKEIASISASTNNRVTCSGAFVGSTAATSFLFIGVGQGIRLVASSLTQWLVTGQSTAALST